jgi:hypothetical protein
MVKIRIWILTIALNIAHLNQQIFYIDKADVIIYKL